MAQKREFLAQIYVKTTLEVTKNLINWTDFLTVVGNLYKYPYHEQLMIYAQKPQAIACAEFEVWNDKMHRYIKRGTSGIALIDPTTDKGQIKYVFDVTDTSSKVNSREPYLWKMQEYHEKPILDMLKNKYSIADKNIYDVIDKIAKNLANEYYIDSKYSISQMTQDSFLEELDALNIELIFENAVSVSIAYTLIKRMGLDVSDYFEHEDFSSIFNFNTPAAISLLGTAVSEQTEEVFREIAKTIIKTERSLQNEQFNLQTRGRLQNSELGITKTSRLHTGQIWQNEKSTPNGIPQTIVQSPTSKREVIPSSNGDRPSSQSQIDTDNERSETTSTRQDDSSDGMDSLYEQPTSTGRGSDFERTDLQLENVKTEQLTLFPSEQEQINNIYGRLVARTEDLDWLDDTLATISFSQEEINHALRKGTGFVDGKLRVYDFYQKDLPSKKIAQKIKAEYGHGGSTHYYLDGRRGWLDCEPSKGLFLSVNGIADKFQISWTDVEKHIKTLISTDNYLTSDEKSKYDEQKLEQKTYINQLHDLYKNDEKRSTLLEPTTEELAEILEPPQEVKVENFHITDNNLGVATKAEKIVYNLDAIRTLKMLEKEDRHSTNAEKITLSRYVGWGGLSEIFEENNTNYLLLKTTLDDDEYTKARASVLNAHYTSPTIIKAIYDTIEKMGFTTGNILEPSCGVGNFFGLLPESMQKSNLYGVELDSITGRIAQKLYPNANIEIKGFEKTEYPDNFFDVAIGNVPFGDYSLTEKRYDNNKFKVHDHFFAKSIDKVRPNGVVAFVTSKVFCYNIIEPEVRKW